MLKKVALGKTGIAFLFVLSILAVNQVAATGAKPDAVAAQQEEDADNDGVPDSRDKCPGTEQLRKIDPKHKYSVAFNAERRSDKPMSVPVDADGCDRDTDGDGVADHKDYCPEDSPLALSAGIAANGCPKHSDKDGTPDYRDKCPDTPAGTKTDMFGCPIYSKEKP